MTKQFSLTSEEISTGRLALTAWINRCGREASTMMQLAEDCAPGSEFNLRAIRNAAASDNFVREAQQLLAKF